MDEKQAPFSASMKELMPLICEVIDSGAEFRLYPRGRSMLPTLVEGEDSVILVSPDELRRMDAVLYRRDNGQYVLHRIVRDHGELLDMCGDNQVLIEKGVPRSSVLAKVKAVYKKDVRIEANDPAYQKEIVRLYAKKPFGRAVLAIKQVLYPFYKRICKR